MQNMKLKRRMQLSMAILFKKEPYPASRSRRNLWVFWRYKRKIRAQQRCMPKKMLDQQRSILMVSKHGTSRVAKVGRAQPLSHPKSLSRTNWRRNLPLLSTTKPVLTKSHNLIKNILTVKSKWKNHQIPKQIQKGHLVSKPKAQLLRMENQTR